MKNRNNFWLKMLFIFSFLIFYSCHKENINTSSEPYSVGIYKTKGDYFNYANTWGTKNGPTSLNALDFRIVISDSDTVFKNRWRMSNGYVMSYGITSKDYFTDMTYSEIVAYNETYPEKLCVPKDVFFDRVIDKDPFTEYYIDDKELFPEAYNYIDEINKIIEDGELDKYFKKLK